MKICRYGNNRLGVVRKDKVHDVTEILKTLGAHQYPLPQHDLLIAALDALCVDLDKRADDVEGTAIEQLSLLSPVANPGKIVAAPVNYLKHLEEARTDKAIHFDNQIGAIQKVGLFLKASSSMIGQGGTVKLRFPDRRTDHEIELVAIIGRIADRVNAKDALDYVAGYCVGLDMTVRGPEERSMRKSIDTFSVLGPLLVSADEFGDPSNIDLELTVNGEIRQKANTRDLVLSVPELIEYASRYYTLFPGDILFTGTPEGVAEVAAGDIIRATVDRVGTLDVSVAG